MMQVIIVKMNETTVECSIAASELHEIGLTPEAVISGAENTTSFFAQLNKEVGAQLDYDPETEVMMMSKNMMMDGSIRIFAVKLSNDDIQKAADRIRGAAETILKTLTQEKDFKQAIHDRWTELYDGGTIDAWMQFLDEQRETIAESQKLDKKKWPQKLKQTDLRGHLSLFTYEEEVDYLKNWLNTRIKWLNSEWHN